MACWASARRKFHESRELDAVRMETVLAWIGKLYAVEKDLRERGEGPWKNLSLDERAVLTCLPAMLPGSAEEDLLTLLPRR